VHRVYGKHCRFRFLFLLPPSNLFYCLWHVLLLSNRPKQVFFNPINIFDTFSFITLYSEPQQNYFKRFASAANRGHSGTYYRKGASTITKPKDNHVATVYGTNQVIGEGNGNQSTKQTRRY